MVRQAHHERFRWLAGIRLFLVATAMIAGATLSAPSAVAEEASQGTVGMEWFGHMTFRFTSPQGVVVWTTTHFEYGGSPIRAADVEHADIILIPNGHSDDRGQVLEVAAKTGAVVVAPGPLGNWLVTQGLDRTKLVTTGAGKMHEIRGITIRTVKNIHDETISDTENMYGGAVGYIIKFENGFTVYSAASSDITMDMQLYGSMYQPHVALLYASGVDPVSLAHMARLIATDNPNLHTIIPSHIRPGDPIVGRVAGAVQQLGLPITVMEPAPGQRYEY